MSQSLMAKRFFREYKLIASQVGASIKFLKDTSCMNPQMREYIACCKIYEIFETKFKDEMTFTDFLKEIAVPSLELLGFATWSRDILTDMGLRISRKPTGASLKKLREKYEQH